MVAAAVLLVAGFSAICCWWPQLIRQSSQASDWLRQSSSRHRDATAATQALLRIGRRQSRGLAAAPGNGGLDAKLRILENTLVTPRKSRVAAVENQNLELLSLRTLPPTTLIERASKGRRRGSARREETRRPGRCQARRQAAPSPAAPNIYKHGIEIRIAGSYNDLLKYLTDLERMPQRIIWNRVTLTAEKYPAAS